MRTVLSDFIKLTKDGFYLDFSEIKEKNVDRELLYNFEDFLAENGIIV